jgi:hypothetical protein
VAGHRTRIAPHEGAADCRRHSTALNGLTAEATVPRQAPAAFLTSFGHVGASAHSPPAADATGNLPQRERSRIRSRNGNHPSGASIAKACVLAVKSARCARVAGDPFGPLDRCAAGTPGCAYRRDDRDQDLCSDQCSSPVTYCVAKMLLFNFHIPGASQESFAAWRPYRLGADRC